MQVQNLKNAGCLIIAHVALQLAVALNRKMMVALSIGDLRLSLISRDY